MVSLGQPCLHMAHRTVGDIDEYGAIEIQH